MKKFLIFLVIILCLTGCKSEEIKNNYDIVSYDVDMSGYDGVNSTMHAFKRVTVDQLFNCIDEKSSAVFYLGRTNCACCQTCVQYLNKAAMELNVTVYYIDVYDKDMPLVVSDGSCPECKERTELLRQYLYDILFVNDEGEKELQTPTVFSIVNGEIADHIICLGNYQWDNPPTEAQINKIINRYKQILKPFSIESQD